jgi:two-component system response regulator BaeR
MFFLDIIESDIMGNLNLSDSKVNSRVFVICDQDATAPIWGYIIREKGLVAIVETSVQSAMDHSIEDLPDLVVVDVNASHQQRMELCKKFRSVSVCPILLFLPVSNESEMLEAYQAGVDECVVKPISPALFIAKIMVWVRRSWAEPMVIRQTKRLQLDPAHRASVDVDGKETKLTNLEFRLLHLLMSRPGFVFKSEDIIQTVWGARRQGDVALLKNMIYRLRKKMEEESGGLRLIQTWPGGYSFLDN